MRWRSKYHPKWTKQFAIFPIMLDDKTVIWLEPYWQRYVSSKTELIKILGNEVGQRACGLWLRVQQETEPT